MTGGNHGGHEQRVADGLAPPPMKLLPRHWPDCRVQRARPTSAATCGDRASPVPAVRRSGAGDDRSDTGHGSQQILLLGPHRRAPHMIVDLAVELGQLLLQRLAQPDDTLLQRLLVRRRSRWASAAIISTIWRRRAIRSASSRVVSSAAVTALPRWLRQNAQSRPRRSDRSGPSAERLAKARTCAG